MSDRRFTIRKRISFPLSVALLSLSAPGVHSSFATVDVASTADTEGGPAAVLNWPSSLWRTIVAQGDHVGVQLNNALFDAIGNIDLVGIGIGSAGGKIGVNSKRTVYDNFDMLQTWTVIDQLSVRGKVPFILDDFGTHLTTPGGFKASVFVGAEAGMNWVNIRQVAALKYRELPSIDFEKNRIESSGSFKDWKAADEEKANEERLNGEPDPNIIELGTQWPWYLFDPSVRPRFFKSLNRLTFPFRLPSNPERLMAMAKNELISYSAFGGAFVGAKVAFDFDGIDEIDVAEIAASGQLYLRGEFIVSVLKESERFARVKLSRIGTFGRSFTAGASVTTDPLLSGHLSLPFGIENSVKFSFIPIRFGWTTEVSDLFDLGYRFDLYDPEAAKAFSQAVKADFVDAGKLDGVYSTVNDGEKAVERLFTREGNRKVETRARKINFLFLHDANKGRSREDFSAKLTLPTGESHIVKASVENTKSKKWLWGVFERRTSGFTVALDEEGYDKNDPLSLFLVAEGKIEDSMTMGDEMAEYIEQAERVTGVSGVVPRVPLYSPELLAPESEHQIDKAPSAGLKDTGKVRYANLGRSSFYYGFNLTRPQVEKWIALPNNRKKDVLTLAFRVAQMIRNHSSLTAEEKIERPMALRKGIKRWTQLDPKRPIKKLVPELRDLLSNRKVGLEWMLALRLGLFDEELDSFIVAQNPGFGQFQNRGKTRANVDQILFRADAQMGFERLAGGFRGDPSAIIRDLKVVSVTDEGGAKLQFTLDAEPKLLNIRLSRTTKFKRMKVMLDIVLINREEKFKKGENTLVLDRFAANLLERQLGGSLTPNDFFLVNLGYSVDGSRWGQAAAVRFQMPEAKKSTDLR